MACHESLCDVPGLVLGVCCGMQMERRHVFLCPESLCDVPCITVVYVVGCKRGHDMCVGCAAVA